jgi:hypothetical protein
VDAESILAAPVGQELLAALATRGRPPSAALEDLDEVALYREAVAAALSVTARGPTADHECRDAELDEVPPAALVTISAGLSHALASSWWSSAWHTRPQLWVGPGARAPVPRAVSQAGRPPTKPPAVLWTASRLSTGASAWWPVVESGLLGAGRSWSAWRVQIPRDVRVFEIRSATDWGRLCTTFPAPASAGEVSPDWSRVTEQYDGVHLTVEGLLCAQGVVVDTPAGRARLWGWDAEGTAWLRWCVKGVAFERKCTS